MRGLSVAQMGGMALAFVLLIVILGVGSTILSEIQSSQCTGGEAGYSGGHCGTGGHLFNTSTIASNITEQGLTGVDTMADWAPTIAVIIAAAVVIGVIVRYFQG